LAALLALLVGACSFSASAGAYVFTDDTVRPTASPVTMWDYSTQRCEIDDIPDAPARAFKDGLGNVVLYSSHFVTRRKVGPDLRSAVPPANCELAMGSTFSADPAMYNDRQWVSAPYILPGGNVVSLLHNEYQGSTHPGQCPSANYFKCWFNSISLGISTDRGRTFAHTSPTPSNLVATSPYRYEADTGPAGIMMPSNIIKFASDNMYYTLVAAQDYGAQEGGTCLMRTGNLLDPTSWRAWDGSGFTVQFVNPYTDSSDPAQHVCEPVSVNEIGMMSASVHYNLYLNKFVLVGQSGNTFDTRQEDPGIYWSTSSDMIHWTRAKQLMKSELLWTHQCGDSDPIMHPSLLDPASASPNFELGGRQVDLFFTQFHYQYDATHCWMGLDRDLIRIPLEFNKPPDCSTLVATPSVLPSMNRSFFPVTLSGATEPDGESMSMKIDSVTQTQPVKGPGDSTSPDAMRTTKANQILLRAEYGPGGAGRVYRIAVTITDSKGAKCSSTEKVAIPKDAVETSASYGSFKVNP
jgi:hypothetical protein